MEAGREKQLQSGKVRTPKGEKETKVNYKYTEGIESKKLMDRPTSKWKNAKRSGMLKRARQKST